MKKLYTFCVFFIVVSIQIVLLPSTVVAQNTVQCGDVITGEFADREDTHTYKVNVNSSDKLHVIVEEIGPYSDLYIRLSLYGPNTQQLENTTNGDLAWILTDILSTSGMYEIRVNNVLNGNATSGKYNLYVDCLKDDGSVISSDRFTQSVQCGSIIESQFQREREIHRYFLNLSQNDVISLRIEETGSYSDLYFLLSLYSPSSQELEDTSDSDLVLLETDTLPVSGIYEIAIENSLNGNQSDGGTYIMYIGCTLDDGTVINPGDAPSTTEMASPSEAIVFSGFGFTGISPVDFSTGIEIPLQTGQPQTAPLGGDVALYTYSASTNETRTLSLARLSGNISVGIAVIKLDTNEVIFFGGMPSSNNLSVELTFPSNGTYAIGLFRVDTAEHSSTSGAVQITLE